MSENTKPNNERPADLAVQDSVGGMARRLLNPAHLRDLAVRSVKTLREQGAEQLLGKGDMLFYPIGTNKPVRVQGAFVSDGELNKIVDFIKKQSIPVEYSEEVTQQVLESDTKGSNAASEKGNDLMSDELFEDAVRLVMDTGQASSSMLQRKFRIGYTRAARLVDCMEELGIVGQSVGSKPRELIMSRHEIEERFFTAQ